MSANNVGRKPRLLASTLACAAVLFGCGEEGTNAGIDSGVVDAGSDAQSKVTDAAPPSGPQVTTTLGKIEGKLVESTRTFLGIPYAKPPVGALRFMPPEPAEPWTGTRMATAFGPSCPQTTGGVSAAGPRSEDCLTLNVYTPSEVTGKLPVMVWLYGGAFVTGGSISYDGTRLSREGPVVVVTLNYRLGALGLLVHPLLDAMRSVPSGNDAMRDQQLALKFVRDNIAAFGGDPDNVTLFGESAGSMSTCLQMVSPTGAALANRYIMESASCIAGLPIETRAPAEARGARLASTLCPGEADVIACLRAKSADELINFGANEGISGAGWAPVTNAADPLLPKHPIALFADGPSTKPLIIGSNLKEWTLFAAVRGLTVESVAQLRGLITAEIDPRLSEDVAAHYIPDGTTDGQAHEIYIRLMTDAFFRCPARATARLAAARGQPSYLYSFEEGLAFHAAEIPYVFGTPLASLGITDIEAGHAVIAPYWLRFAKTGDPNGGTSLAWPRYEEATDRHLVLKVPPTTGEALAKDDCDFWNAIFPRILE